MKKIIEGYKAFNKDMKNRYGYEFAEGKTYSVKGPLEFGTTGNGFHFCKRLEDTLRYFPTINNEEVKFAKVTSLDEAVEFYDEYYGYYDMYAARKIKIEKILTRKEIISMFLNTYEERVIRFLAGFRLTPEEKEIFRIKYLDSMKIQLAISYYQDGDKDAYSRQYERGKVIEKNKKKFS